MKRMLDFSGLESGLLEELHGVYFDDGGELVSQEDVLTIVEDPDEAPHGTYYGQVEVYGATEGQFVLEGEKDRTWDSDVKAGFSFQFNQLPDYHRTIMTWYKDWESLEVWAELRLLPNGKLQVVEPLPSLTKDSGSFVLDPGTVYFIEMRTWFAEADVYGSSNHQWGVAVNGVERIRTGTVFGIQDLEAVGFGIRTSHAPGVGLQTIGNLIVRVDDMFLETRPDEEYYGNAGVSGWLRPTALIGEDEWSADPAGDLWDRLNEWPAGVEGTDEAVGYGILRLEKEASAPLLPENCTIVAVKHTALVVLGDLTGSLAVRLLEIGFRKGSYVYTQEFNVADDGGLVHRYQHFLSAAPGDSNVTWTPSLLDAYELYLYAENTSDSEQWAARVAEAAFFYVDGSYVVGGGGAGGVAIPPFASWHVNSSLSLSESFAAQLNTWKSATGGSAAYRSGRVRAVTLITTTGNADNVEVEVFIGGEGTGFKTDVNLSGGKRVLEIPDGALPFAQGENLELRFRRISGGLGAGIHGTLHVAYDE